MSLKEEKLTKSEDCRGQKCPYPNLSAKRAMKEASEGDIVDFWIDYEPAIKESLPTLCQAGGWECEVEKDESGEYWHFYIKK
jgi:tRNA 2-thiouridine synthesizing protein A